MRPWTVRLTAVSVFAVVLTPIAVLVLWALADSWNYPQLFPELTLRYVGRYLSSGWIWDPLANSMLLSVTVTFLSLILGFFPAKYLGTKEFRGIRAVRVLVMLPALTPAIAVVFGMLPVLVNLGLYMSFWGLVLVQLTFTLPYMIMTLTSVFKNYDTDYELQSSSLGVGKLDTLLSVTLPAVRSGVAVGCMYTFIVSWSMYLITSMYAPRGFGTLVTVLLPLASGGTTTTQDVAITAIVFFLPVLLVLALSALAMRSDRDRQRRGP